MITLIIIINLRILNSAPKIPWIVAEPATVIEVMPRYDKCHNYTKKYMIDLYEYFVAVDFFQMVFIVFGLPGSGKSYFAAHLADMLDAVYISSDQVRKEMFHHRTYSKMEKSAVYKEMLARMINKTKQTGGTVLDATFYTKDLRKEFVKRIERSDDIFFIEIRAGESLIKERMQKERKDSEADFEIYKKIKSEWEPMTEQHLILESTNTNIRDMLEKTADYLNLKHD